MPSLSKEELEQLGWDLLPAQVSLGLKTADEGLPRMRLAARGYAGWLLTNRQFLTEQHALIADWHSYLQAEELFCRGRLTLAADLDPGSGKNLPALDFPEQYHRRFRDFFIRWRLLGLPAPGLPAPMKPAMAGLFPVSVLPQLYGCGRAIQYSRHLPNSQPGSTAVNGGKCDSKTIRLRSPCGMAPNRTREQFRQESHRPLLRVFRLIHYWRVYMAGIPPA